MKRPITSANVDRLVRQLRKGGGAEGLISGLRTFLAARDGSGRPIRPGDTVNVDGQDWRVPWVVSELKETAARVVSVTGAKDVPYHLLERA